MKVSDFEFVAGAEVDDSDADRKMETDARYEELVAEIMHRFPWGREREVEVEDLRTKMWAGLLDEHAGR